MADNDIFSFLLMDNNFRTTVDLPTPEGPEMTTSKPLLPFVFLGMGNIIVAKRVDFGKPVCQNLAVNKEGKYMKKILLGLLVLSLMASVSSAQFLVGARAAGMGGVGVATCRDLSAAYYNPAAIMKTGAVGGMASVGVAYDGMDKIIAAAAGAADPAKFVSDNFANTIDLNGSIGGIFGLNINKIGISVLPALGLQLAKPAASLQASGMAGLNYNVPVTFGHTFGIPGLPSIDVGANLKYVGQMGGFVTANALGAGTQTIANSTGFGLDLGALMTFNIPAVTELSVGLAIRDLAENLNTNTKTYTLTPGPSNTFTSTLASDVNTSAAVNSSFALGVAGNIPVVGLLCAADLESGNGFTNTHIGVEYPILAGLAAIRAGLASGNALSLTTFGAKIGLPFFTLNAAMMMDGKNTKNNQIFVDLAGGV